MIHVYIHISLIYSGLAKDRGGGGQKEKSKTERDRRREGLCSLSQASQAASESHDNIEQRPWGFKLLAHAPKNF